MASARRLKIPSLTYIALYNSAQSALAHGERGKTARMLRKGIEWARRTKDKANLAHLLEALAAVTALGGEAQRSAVLLGAAQALLEEVGARVYNYYIPDRSFNERTTANVHAQLGEEGFAEARYKGRAMTFEQAVEYALGVRP